MLRVGPGCTGAGPRGGVSAKRGVRHIRSVCFTWEVSPAPEEVPPLSVEDGWHFSVREEAIPAGTRRHGWELSELWWRI